MRFGLHPDHPRFICESLRQLAGGAREEEALYLGDVARAQRMAQACAHVANRLDIVAGALDPTSELSVGVALVVLTSAMEDLRSCADAAQVAGEPEAYDLYSEAVETLDVAYGRSQLGRLVERNGRH